MLTCKRREQLTANIHRVCMHYTVRSNAYISYLLISVHWPMYGTARLFVLCVLLCVPHVFYNTDVKIVHHSMRACLRSLCMCRLLAAFSPLPSTKWSKLAHQFIASRFAESSISGWTTQAHGSMASMGANVTVDGCHSIENQFETHFDLLDCQSIRIFRSAGTICLRFNAELRQQSTLNTLATFDWALAHTHTHTTGTVRPTIRQPTTKLCVFR